MLERCLGLENKEKVFGDLKSAGKNMDKTEDRGQKLTKDDVEKDMDVHRRVCSNSPAGECFGLVFLPLNTTFASKAWQPTGISHLSELLTCFATSCSPECCAQRGTEIVLVTWSVSTFLKQTQDNMQVAVEEIPNLYHLSKGRWYITGMSLISSRFLLAYCTLYISGGKLC